LSTASSRRGGRAFWLGSRAGRLVITAFVLACLAAGTVYWLTAHQASASAAASQKYGGLPSWLPKSKIPTGRVVQASAAHPQLAIEGDSVVVKLAHASVTATVVGPNVPEEGQFPVPATSPCAFTVTFTRATGVIPLKAAAFTVLDELGQLHYLRITAQGGGKAPAQVTPGKTVTLIMSDVLPTGTGTLRWSPVSGSPVVSWDFDVEID
jgi:hypothetical protein